jgi:hypothetical protein
MTLLKKMIRDLNTLKQRIKAGDESAAYCLHTPADGHGRRNRSGVISTPYLNPTRTYKYCVAEFVALSAIKPNSFNRLRQEVEAIWRAEEQLVRYEIAQKMLKNSNDNE